MTSTSIKKDPEAGEEDTSTEDVLRLMVQALKDENGSLKRELAIWQRRAERAEAECLKWKATADEWRLEFMKKARSKALGQRHD
jgi:hypothetical protein